MKVLITENKFENLVIRYLDDMYYPDYGFYENDRTGTYQDYVDKFGDLCFFINDVESYFYYGCNAGNGKEDKLFAPYGSLFNYKCPLLSISPPVSQRLREMFGNKWKPIFKKWFEHNTGLKVEEITDDYV